MDMDKKIILILIGLGSLFWSQPVFASCGNTTQFNCMVATINGEARGEGYKGMLVVGKALKTRKIRGYLGKSICGISKRSFAPKSLSRTGTKGKTKANIIKAAKAACASGDAGYTHFHSFKSKNATKWARQFAYKGKVGRHWLFNAPRGTKANFDGLVASNIISEENFFTEADVFYYEAQDEDALSYYTEEDDNEVEEILSTPIDDSIRI